MITHIFR